LGAEGGLFIGVGAAHLSGHDGLVELLRQSGHTVTAVECVAGGGRPLDGNAAPFTVR
jgi:TraB/PrgY/gumN family